MRNRLWLGMATALITVVFLQYSTDSVIQKTAETIPPNLIIANGK